MSGISKGTKSSGSVTNIARQPLAFEYGREQIKPRNYKKLGATYRKYITPNKPKKERT